MAFFFTSDTHLDHGNVITYCKRPFVSVDEMNEQMIYRWNYRVKSGDTVYHLGDFHMGKRERVAPLRERLNGRIILVRGNHDRSPKVMRECGFDDVYHYMLFSDPASVLKI